MPDGGASIWAPLLIGGASAGAQIYGAKKASSASKQAAAVQQQGAERALAIQSQNYADAKQRYAPYQAVGAQALQNLPQIAGRVPYAQYGLSLSGLNQYGQGQPPAGMMASSGGVAGAAMRAGGTASPSAVGGMVTIEAPTGERQQVPANQVQHYLSKGGRMVS